MTITNIINEARDLVDADASSYPATAVTDSLLRRINTAYEEVVGKLITISYRGWLFGDSNYTALPTGLFTLVNSQEGYQLTGNGTTGIDITTPLLNFLGVSVKDNAGLWHTLSPISFFYDIHGAGSDPVEYYKTDGLPAYYEKREDFLILYPAPDNGVSVTLSSGLKVFFQRGASTFTAAEVVTGTKQPGFALPYHSILSYKAALPYAMSYKKDRVPMIMAEINRLEREMEKFYAQRPQDEKRVMTMRPISYK